MIKLQRNINYQMNIEQEFREQTLSQNILSQKNSSTGNTVYYVSVYKESDSGLMFNGRMLVLQDKNFNIFYTKHYKPIFSLSQMAKKGQVPIKQQLCIINTNAEIQEDTITIRFIKNNIKMKWVFKFSNEKLAVKWFVLYKDNYQKCIAKSIKSKTKQTGTHSSSSNSDYASILSQNRYYQTYSPHVQGVKIEYQQQKQFSKRQQSGQLGKEPSKKLFNQHQQ